MLFHRDDLAGLHSCLHDELLVERLDRADVDDFRVDPVLRQHLRCLERGSDAQSVGQDADVLTFAKDIALSDFELVVFGEDDRNRRTAETDIDKNVRVVIPAKAMKDITRILDDEGKIDMVMKY